MLAVLVRSPRYYDPEAHPEEAKDRWEGARRHGDEGWLTRPTRPAVYPPVPPRQTSGTPTTSARAWAGQVKDQVLDELDQAGYTRQQIDAGGLRITTTVDQGHQDAASRGERRSPTRGRAGQALRQALVAVDPKTGGVLAYYGGPNGAGHRLRAGAAPAGSSLKPYVLATALERRWISVTAGTQRDQRLQDYDVSSPDRRHTGAQLRRRPCPACTLQEAITESLNTTFYGLTTSGPGQRPRPLLKAPASRPSAPGTRARRRSQDPKTAAPRPVWASASTRCARSTRPSGFATFAAGGVHREPYFVAKVDRLRAARCSLDRHDERRAGHPRRRRQRRHLRDRRRRGGLQARAGRRPRGRQQDRHPGYLDDRRQLRRLDGRLHPVRSRRRSGWARTATGHRRRRRARHLRVGAAGCDLAGVHERRPRRARRRRSCRQGRRSTGQTPADAAGPDGPGSAPPRRAADPVADAPPTPTPATAHADADRRRRPTVPPTPTPSSPTGQRRRPPAPTRTSPAGGVPAADADHAH